MFGKVEYYRGKDFSDWEKSLDSLTDNKTKDILYLIAADTNFDFNKINNKFEDNNINACGCIFPGIIFGEKLYKEGFLACSFNVPVSFQKIKKISEFSDLDNETIFSDRTKTIIVINDGFSNNIPLFLEKLFENTVSDVKFIGGGCGWLGCENYPSIFYGNDFFSDGAVIIQVEDKISFGIDHGWEPLYSTLIATESDRHILKSINWEPAYQCYKRILEENEGVIITKENFINCSKKYPFGMIKYDNEIVLRALIKLDDDENIIMGSEFPENSVLSIMKGEPENLINAASSAVDKAMEKFKKTNERSASKVFVIDCVLRSMFLEERYSDELNIIMEKTGDKVDIFGFLSLGEIASSGDKYIELYNKTIVVSID